MQNVLNEHIQRTAIFTTNPYTYLMTLFEPTEGNNCSTNGVKSSVISVLLLKFLHTKTILWTSVFT